MSTPNQTGGLADVWARMSGAKIGEMFMIISTPTFLIIRPDGVIDSVILSGLENLEKTLEAKKRELTGSSKTSGS